MSSASMATSNSHIDVIKPLREGFLFKEGGSTKTWHKRYFALYPGLLVYYQKFSYYKKDREKGDLKHKINEISVGQCSATVPDWQPRPHTFVLHTGTDQKKNKRSRYVLSACSSEDKNLWMNALMSQSSDTHEHEALESAELSQGKLDAIEADNDTDDWSDDSDDPNVRHSVRTGTEVMVEMEAAEVAATGSSQMETDVPGYARVNKQRAETVPFSRDSVLSSECEAGEIVQGITVLQDIVVPGVVIEEDAESGNESSTTEDEDVHDEEPVTQPTSGTGTSSDSEEDEPSPKQQRRKLQKQEATIEVDHKPGQGTHQASLGDNKSERTATATTINDHESERDTSQMAPVDIFPLIEEEEELAPDTVITEGVLHKQGGRHKSWKVRFFRLFPGLVCYYTSKHDVTPIHQIKLDGARVLVPPGPTKRQHQFTLQTTNYWNKRSDYILAASSDSERRAWIEALKRGSRVKKKTEFGTYDRRARIGATISPSISPGSSPRVTQTKKIMPSVQSSEPQHSTSLSPVPSPIATRSQKANIAATQATASPVVSRKSEPTLQTVPSPIATRSQKANIAATQATASPVVSRKSEPTLQTPAEVMKTATESLKAAAAIPFASDSRKEFLGDTVELWLPGHVKDRPLSSMRMRSVDEAAELQNSKEKKQFSKTHLRHLVSKQKKRYVHNDFDLDLTYVTNKIIAMGFPSEGAESVYRNKLADVQRLLDSRHKGHYKLYNLCSERAYPANKFYNRVAYYPFDDHCAPTLPLMSAFCSDVHEWLALDDKNVAAVNCKAGKGRTGCLISAYLLHADAFPTAEASLSYFGETRTYNGKGVTIPSQKRYVKYYENCLKMGIPTIRRVSRQLQKIRMFTVPNVDALGGCNPYFVIYENNEQKYTSKKSDQSVDREKGKRIVIHDCSVTLAGDIQLQLFDYDRFSEDEFLCSVYFNTIFVDAYNKLFFKRAEIDRACKKKRKEFSDDFCLELVFEEATRK